MSAVLEVKWNGKKFPVEFASTHDLETTTVKELKSYIQRMTGISDASSMKLNAFGALMNNDDIPLSIYGLRPGNYITLKVHHNKAHHNKENHKQQQQQDKEVPTVQNNKEQDHKKHGHRHYHHHHNNKSQQPLEQQKQLPNTTSGTLTGEAKLLQDLELIKDKLYMEITPQVKKYEKDVKGFLSPQHVVEESLAKEKKKYFYMGAPLGEQLMHVFFDLDAFACGPDNLNARQKRKELVKQAQALLDKVDEIKSLVKNVTVPEEN